MAAYATKHKIDIPSGFDPKRDSFGDFAKELLKGIQAHAKLRPSGIPTSNTMQALGLLPSYHIEHDYHAIHHSGTRPLSAVNFLVLHDMEDTAYKTAAEDVGRYFEMEASGGSSHYGVDNNSIQQYLGLNVVAWGAPSANYDGIHIEQMGSASWSRSEWHKKAGDTIDRTAWLLAYLHNITNIPLRLLSVQETKARTRGVITHKLATAAFGGTHTDPGSGYPLDDVIDRANEYARYIG
jgi:hypothetical protein